MRNIKFIVEYDGTDFYGWQRQPGLRTVQVEIERAIEQFHGRRPMGHDDCHRLQRFFHRPEMGA